MTKRKQFDRKLSLSIDTLHQRLEALRLRPDTFANRRRIDLLEKKLQEAQNKVPV